MVLIEHYTAERIPDPEGNVSFWDFHEARNAVVRVCKLHGPTGPFGELPLEKVAASEEWIPLWERGHPDAVYYVVDDQYNSERYQYVECPNSAYFTEEWIRDLMAALRNLPGWGVGIGVPSGYVLVFASKLMVTGDRFQHANDLASVVSNAQLAIKHDKVEGRKNGACKNYFFENDSFVCTADYGDDRSNNLILERNSVKKVWRNPFTGGWMLTFNDGSHLVLPDEEAFTMISKWL